MSSFVLTDATIWIGGWDFTTDSNSLSIKVSADEQDATTFGGNGYRARRAGLRDVEANIEGFWQSALNDAAVDPQLFNALGIANRTWTVAPFSAEGSPAYLFTAGKWSYELFGSIGDMAPFKVDASGTGGVGLVRGKKAAAPASVGATGQFGSVVELTAPSATQFVYASFHVFTPGTTITVAVESDDSAGFASPTVRGTIGPITAQGGTWMTRIAGPFVGETHWRFNVSAVTGSFLAAGAIAVQ